MPRFVAFQLGLHCLYLGTRSGGGGIKQNHSGHAKMPRSWCLRLYLLQYRSTLCLIVLFGVGLSKENTHNVWVSLLKVFLSIVEILPFAINIVFDK